MITAKMTGNTAAILSAWLIPPALAMNAPEDPPRVEKPNAGQPDRTKIIDDTWREINETTERLWNSGRFDLAIENAKSALAVAERSFPADDVRIGISLYRLSSSKDCASDPAGAEPLARRAVAILEKARPRPTEDLVFAYFAHMNSLGGLKNYDEAEAVLRKASAVAEEVHGRDAPILACFSRLLGEVRNFQGKPKEAEPLLRRAIALAEKNEDKRNRSGELARDCWILGKVLMKLDRVDEAKPLLEQGVQLHEATWGSKHPRLVGPLRDTAICMRKGGHKQEAEALLRRALAIQESFPSYKVRGVDEAVTEYASLLRELGREAEAQRLEKQGKTGTS